MLKVTLNLQLLQNIDRIPHVVQGILVLFLTSNTLYLPVLNSYNSHPGNH